MTVALNCTISFYLEMHPLPHWLMCLQGASSAPLLQLMPNAARNGPTSACPDCIGHWLVPPLRNPPSDPDDSDAFFTVFMIDPGHCAPLCGSSAGLHWHVGMQALRTGSGIAARCGWQVAIWWHRRLFDVHERHLRRVRPARTAAAAAGPMWAWVCSEQMSACTPFEAARPLAGGSRICRCSHCKW